MNIYTQVCGLCILILVMYCCKRRKSLSFYSQKLFLATLYMMFTCLVIDIVSIIMIVNPKMFPFALTEFLCKLYLVVLGIICSMTLIYATADINHLAKADRFTTWVLSIVVAAAVVIFFLPIHIYHDGFVIYTYGPACIATYAGAFFLIVSTIITLITRGASMSPKRRTAIAFWLIIWIAAALVQFFNSQILIVSFAGALGTAILFFELENPEFFIDSATDFYNSYAFTEYIRHCYQLHKSCCGLLISLEDSHDSDYNLNQLDTVMADVVNFFKHISDATVYRTDTSEFVFLFKSRDELSSTYAAIEERFKNQWLTGNEDVSFGSTILLRPHYLIIPSLNVAENSDEMLALLRYYRLHCNDVLGRYTMTLDIETVAQKRGRDAMLESVSSAIKEDRIEVFYQPIYSTTEHKFVAAEALARIRKPDGKIIPPGLFIPVAEETGLITKIGEIVFEKTCQFIKDNDLKRYGVRCIDVNLSVLQCESETLADEFIEIMKRYELSPDCINLEITESSSTAKKDILLSNMRSLIDYGVKFSLDDFGNGQCNLNYIVDMPVQVVKFDYDMTQAYFKTEKAKLVLEATTNMIHEMKLTIISEGVETKEQFDVISGLGIDYIQGYYFSKPLEADAYISFIKEHNMN